MNILKFWPKNQKNRLHQTGAALLEVIVAVGIVTLVMTTIVSLVTVSLKGASLAQQKTLGTKYAQEGLESMRQMRNVLGWDAFLATLQADGTTIHYCLTTVPSTAAEFAAIPNAACTSSQFVDSKNIFQRQADITIVNNGASTSVAIVVTVTWDDAGVTKSVVVNQQFQEYNQADAPVPVIYSPLPYSYSLKYGNGAWMYRKEVPIVNFTGVTQSSFQVRVSLNTATLISAGKMKAGCADLRMTDADGSTDLPFWVEPLTCNTAVTQVWVKIPSIPTTGTNIYAYYGNPAATAATYLTTDVFIREVPNVILAYNMDETWNANCSTNTVIDYSGNNHWGVACPSGFGGPNTIAGRVNNGGGFVTNQFVRAANSVYNAFGTTSFTASAWLKTTAAGSQSSIFSISPSTLGFRFGWTGDELYFLYGDGTHVVESSFPASHVIDGAWHMLTIVYNHGGTADGYVDGQSVGSISIAAVTGSISNTYNLWVGSMAGGPGNGWVNGTLDDLRLYSRALSAAEISDMAGAGNTNEGYVTTNYPNNELVRKYSTQVQVGTVGAEQTGF